MRKQRPFAECSEAQLLLALQRMWDLNWACPRADDAAALRSLLHAAAGTLPSLSAASCQLLAEAMLCFAVPGSQDHAAACTPLLRWSLHSGQLDELSGVLQEWTLFGLRSCGGDLSDSCITSDCSADEPSGSAGAPHAAAPAPQGDSSLTVGAQAELQPALLRLLRDREAQPWRVAASLRLWSMLRWPLPGALSPAASSALWWHLPRMEAPLVSQTLTAAARGRQHQLDGWQLGKRATQAVRRALLRLLPMAAAPEVADLLLAAPKLLDEEDLSVVAPVAEAALLRVLPLMDGRQLAAAARACFWGGWQMSPAVVPALFAEAAALGPAEAQEAAPVLRAQLLRMLGTHHAALGRGIAAEALERDRRLLLRCILAWAGVGSLDSQLAAVLSETLPRILTGAAPQQMAAALRVCRAAGWAGQLQPGVMQLLELWLAAHRLRIGRRGSA